MAVRRACSDFCAQLLRREPDSGDLILGPARYPIRCVGMLRLHAARMQVPEGDFWFFGAAKRGLEMSTGEKAAVEAGVFAAARRSALESQTEPPLVQGPKAMRHPDTLHVIAYAWRVCEPAVIVTDAELAHLTRLYWRFQR